MAFPIYRSVPAGPSTMLLNGTRGLVIGLPGVETGVRMISSDAPLLRGARVLVVEDEYLLARDIADALRAEGAHVIGPAATSDAAALLIDTEALDCAVLDMNLRGDRSGDVASRLDSQGVGYVVVSGYASAALPEAVRSRPYLAKPTTSAAVTDAVSRVIEDAASRG